MLSVYGDLNRVELMAIKEDLLMASQLHGSVRVEDANIGNACATGGALVPWQLF